MRKRRGRHAVLGGEPLSLSLSKILLNLLYNNPAQSFTIDELLRFPVVKRRKAKRNTVRIQLERQRTNGLIEKVRLADGRTWAYRVKDPNAALSFIRNEASKPWVKVPPNPPEVSFEIQNRHRVTYLIHLSKEDLERVMELGQVAPNKRNGGLLLLRRKQFTLSVSVVTGRGQIWLFNGWDAEVRRVFSQAFCDNLVQMVSAREGQEHISVPVEFMGHKIRIGGSYLHLCGSHYPFEIDISGPEKDRNKVKAVQILTDQLEFAKVMLGIRDSIDAMLGRIGNMEKTEGELAKNQADMVKILGQLSNGYQPGEAGADASISYR